MNGSVRGLSLAAGHALGATCGRVSPDGGGIYRSGRGLLSVPATASVRHSPHAFTETGLLRRSVC